MSTPAAHVYVVTRDRHAPYPVAVFEDEADAHAYAATFDDATVWRVPKEPA